MKKIQAFTKFIDEAFYYNKYACLFIFFLIGFIVSICLFKYYGEINYNDIRKIVDLNKENNSLTTISSLIGTILTVTVSLSPSLLSQLNRRYKNDQLKKSYLLEPSYIVTKRIGFFLIATSVICMAVTLSPIILFLVKIFLTLIFIVALFAFAKLIVKIEQYVSNTDAMLLEKFETEIDKILE